MLWQHITAKGIGKWEVHSTLVLSAQITAVDYKAGELANPVVRRWHSSSSVGMLVVGTRNGIELWKHDPKAAIVVWNRLWERYVSLSDVHKMS